MQLAHALDVDHEPVRDAMAAGLVSEEQAGVIVQEALAEEACRFTITDDGHGLCHGRFTLPSPVGAMLKQSVLALNAPKHRHHTGTPRGLGHAFCEYVPQYPTDRLPTPEVSTPPSWSR